MIQAVKMNELFSPAWLAWQVLFKKDIFQKFSDLFDFFSEFKFVRLAEPVLEIHYYFYVLS